MTLTLWKRAFVAALACCLFGCAVPQESGPKRTPVRWIMVEKRVGELVPEGRTGDGQVDPQAVVLTLQPLYSEDVNWEVVVDPHDYFVEILEITPSTQASPGETVSAKVRVGRARQDEVYRLIARASQADVEILGERERIVRGSAPVSFRFTSVSAGRGGIAIGVEKVEGGER